MEASKSPKNRNSKKKKSDDVSNNNKINEQNNIQKRVKRSHKESDIEMSIMICMYKGFEVQLLREKRDNTQFFNNPECPEFIAILIQHKNEEVVLDLSGLYFRINDNSYIFQKNDKEYELFHDLKEDVWLLIRHVKGKEPIIVYYAKSIIPNGLYPPKYNWIRN